MRFIHSFFRFGDLRFFCVDFFSPQSLKEFCRGRCQKRLKGCQRRGASWLCDHAAFRLPCALAHPLLGGDITGKESEPLPGSEAITSQATKSELLTFSKREEGGDKDKEGGGRRGQRNR